MPDQPDQVNELEVANDANKGEAPPEPVVMTRSGRTIKPRVRLIETMMIKAYEAKIAKPIWNHLPYKVLVQASKFELKTVHCYTGSSLDPDTIYLHEALREPN